MFAHYGDGTCACCGTTDELTIDHVHGDGAEHRRVIGEGGGALYHWLVVNGLPDGFQVLCDPCNRSKGRGPACRTDHERTDADAALAA